MNMEFHEIGNSAGKFELFLPIAPETLSGFASVPTVVREWQNLSADQIANALREKLDSITTSTVKNFRDLFLSFTPTSILEFDGAWEFRFSNSADVTNFSCGSNFFLPANDHDIQVELDKFSHAYDVHSTEFIEFFQNFSGLSSSSFGHEFATNFFEFLFLELDVDDNWEESVILFSECNGDLLLMNESQEVGWWYHESNEVGHFVSSFADFLKKYTDFKTRYLDPFGSYTAYAPKSLR